MASVYLAVNGDDVGHRIGQAIASDDHEGLSAASSSIQQGHDMISQWAESVGGKVVTSQGDEGIYLLPQEALGDLEQIRAQYQENSGHALTAGIGSSMSEASKALIYGKLNGKNQVVEYSPEMDGAISGEDEEMAPPQEGEIPGAEGEVPPPASPMEAEGQAEDAEMQGEYVGAKSPMEPEHEEDMSENAEMMHDAAENEADELDQDNIEADSEAPVDGTGMDGKIDGEEDFGTDPNDPDFQPSPEEGAVDPSMEEGMEDPSMMGEEDPATDPSMEAEGEGESPYDGIAPETEDPAGEPGMEDPMAEPGAEDEAGEDYDHNDAIADMIHGQMEGEEGEEDGMATEGEVGADDALDDELKADISAALMSFKENRHLLEDAKAASPELYDAMLTMLRSMIDMAKRLGYGPEEDIAAAEMQEGFPQAEGSEEEMPMEEPAPEEEVPADGEEEDPEKKRQGSPQ